MDLLVTVLFFVAALVISFYRGYIAPQLKVMEAAQESRQADRRRRVFDFSDDKYAHFIRYQHTNDLSTSKRVWGLGPAEEPMVKQPRVSVLRTQRLREGDLVYTPMPRENENLTYICRVESVVYESREGIPYQFWAELTELAVHRENGTTDVTGPMSDKERDALPTPLSYGLFMDPPAETNTPTYESTEYEESNSIYALWEQICE